ncbi:MAG: alpha/beta hydrolase [Burkholderiaceae bacterium]|jgi:pimeloyl-ACP methyl ester carboxylesterase|nr:alpha/beta hydrolase [Burkholderiaceae bacterium]
MLIEANGLQIAVERDEPPGGARGQVLLVMGLGGQLIHWPAALVRALVDEGWGVIRMDNRDAGLSTHLSALGRPRLGRIAALAWLGLRPHAPYTLRDMAQDALGVLDALGVARAHVVGVSMGAMIAQRVALAAPQRVQTLVSIMGSSGARGLLRPKASVVRAAAGKPIGGAEEAQAQYYMRFLQAVASPVFPPSEADLRAALMESARRSRPDDLATLRQSAAILADGARARELARMNVPTLVMHGRADPWVPLACGVDTARRIPGARLAVIEDMGHDLVPVAHPEIVRRVLAELLPFLRTAGAAA